MTAREQSFRDTIELQKRISDLPKAPTSEELLSTTFAPIPWIVPGLITTGLTIIAGAPKLGKSWLILGMAWAISVGGCILGKIHVEKSKVLFLALEDTPRRIKDRLQKMGAIGSGNLYLPTKWPAGPECVRYLDAWMLKYPQTRIVFIDTLGKVSGVEDGNDYGQTYGSAMALKSIGDRYGIAIVAIYHSSKAKQTDFIHSVVGSVGLTGAADTVIIMTRPRGHDDGLLSITGRDVEEREYGIRFDQDIGTWSLLDTIPKTPSMRSGNCQKVIGQNDDL